VFVLGRNSLSSKRELSVVAVVRLRIMRERERSESIVGIVVGTCGRQ